MAAATAELESLRIGSGVTAHDAAPPRHDVAPPLRECRRLDLGGFSTPFDAVAHNGAARAQPHYDYFCVVDFECTCDQANAKAHEIIEFPGVFLNARTLDVDFEFHCYVRPTEIPKLTDFCTELTGITQNTVDASELLESALCKFRDFCNERGLVATRRTEEEGQLTFCIATDGPWDVCKFLAPELKRKRIVGFTRAWQNVVDVRKTFREHFRMTRGGVCDMLAAAGLKFEGREHSGLADSRNIARLLAVLLADGADVRHNLDGVKGGGRR